MSSTPIRVYQAHINVWYSPITNQTLRAALATINAYRIKKRTISEVDIVSAIETVVLQ